VQGNTKLSMRQAWKVAAGVNRTVIELPSKAWEAATEHSEGIAEVLVLTVSGVLNCDDPSLGGGYQYVDALMAGFSGGE